MATSEHFSFHECACPCGEGKITREVESPDHAFAKTYTSYELHCPKCSAVWDLQDKTLVDRKTDQAYKALRDKWHAAHDALRKIARPLIDAHIAKLQLPKPAAERKELNKLGFLIGDTRRYNQQRKFRSPGEIAPIGNGQGLVELAGEQKAEVEKLLEEATLYSQQMDDALGKVGRIWLPDLKKKQGLS